ncbi:peptidoglycan editing factor PgeF [Caenibacillus caldisaponilyticus]|uniref:peptidoglycan editing factor PgeF n=1 Tax=Caenibacillus caldisaponilyticus TaxID=1674942 RepID=UPI001EE6F65D|nr:peptidoglycan editing factor PgeF [Caenibacillus caldisaponilyticus]
MGGDVFKPDENGLMNLAPVETEAGLIKAGITVRHGGVSASPFASLNLGYHVGDDPAAVTENRRRVAGNIGLSLSRWVQAEQVHGAAVQRVTGADAGKGALDIASAIKGVDGLYTTETDLVLTGCFADCVPLFFWSKKKAVVGLAHAGWRGTVAGIARVMVERWTEAFHLHPDEIMVAIGPSIGPCCYEVDDRVVERVHSAADREADRVLKKKENGRYMLNLQELNALILQKRGIPRGNILPTSFCTSCRHDLFYSHRKENGKTGRMLGYIFVAAQDEQQRLR